MSSISRTVGTVFPAHRSSNKALRINHFHKCKKNLALGDCLASIDDIESPRGEALHYLTYLRLIVLTAGALLPFFWIVVILGHRRQRNFERVFFFVCLALFFFFGASLLSLNAQLYYPVVPSSLATFSWTVLCAGLWFLPTLLIHLHVEYAQIRELLSTKSMTRLWLAAAYAPAAFLLPWFYLALRSHHDRDFLLPGNSLGRPFQVWLVCALLVCTAWQWRFKKSAPDEQQRSFHKALLYEIASVALWVLLLHLGIAGMGEASGPWAAGITTIAACSALMPLVSLIRNVQRFNFLQIGRQQNLIYAVFAAIVGLLYLGFIRRTSQWLEPFLPPEATAGILLFLPVFFFEPLQRLMKRILRRTAQTELDRAHRTMGPIQESARLGNLEELIHFIEKWIRQELQLAEVKLAVDGNEKTAGGQSSSEEVFPIRQGGRAVGTLRVKAHGAMLSGETAAALEFLCEQLPAALDLCRLIEEKLRLERELAERERLALVGQMAASISHNLKNPLGSMKTILQVQLENPELPETIRGETKMVLQEISRLSTKLNQLLQFSRPAVRLGGGTASCDVTAVVEEVVAVLSHEAERRGLKLRAQTSSGQAQVAISEEALNDILSNLVVNALEATAHGGLVTVSAVREYEACRVLVEDDGPGIPGSLREKILQPFFTTKSQGTGLGLAIVARRVVEFGGNVDWESPVKNGHGTRFKVTLPLDEAKK